MGTAPPSGLIITFESVMGAVPAPTRLGLQSWTQGSDSGIREGPGVIQTRTYLQKAQRPDSRVFSESRHTLEDQKDF